MPARRLPRRLPPPRLPTYPSQFHRFTRSLLHRRCALPSAPLVPLTRPPTPGWLYTGVIMEEFSRIQRLPPYVFNITGEMKIAARRRGEDIIDFGMGNPDGATPKHIVDKMIEAVRSPSPTATRSPAACRACARPSATGTKRATTSISILRPRPSSPSAPRRASPISASPFSIRATRCWCPTPATPSTSTAR